MELELRQLSPDHGFDEYYMLQEIDNNEFGFTNEVKGMSYREYKTWLKQQDDYSKAQNLPQNWIPQTTYFLYIDGLPVGIGRIRHCANEFLERQGVGNFGYGIAKSFRGNGYGDSLFQNLLEKCRDMGYLKIKLFPYIDNIATNKIMRKHGAILLGTINGEKNIYEISLYR